MANDNENERLREQLQRLEEERERARDERNITEQRLYDAERKQSRWKILAGLAPVALLSFVLGSTFHMIETPSTYHPQTAIVDTRPVQGTVEFRDNDPISTAISDKVNERIVDVMKHGSADAVKGVAEHELISVILKRMKPKNQKQTDLLDCVEDVKAKVQARLYTSVEAGEELKKGDLVAFIDGELNNCLEKFKQARG
jgi:hypothetical protein